MTVEGVPAQAGLPVGETWLMRTGRGPDVFEQSLTGPVAHGFGPSPMSMSPTCRFAAGEVELVWARVAA